jgi:chromate transport protein ChrA
MKMKDAVLFMDGLGLVFLISSAYKDFLTSNFWNLFMDIEFVGIAVYMIWVYPKRKLKLNDDLMILLVFHFSVFTFNSLYRQEWLRFFLGLSFCLVLIGYRIYRKKHKYSFYLKK